MGEGELSYARNEEQLSSAVTYDGIFALRTSVPAEKMDTESAVTSYKLLTRVERRFRHIKTDLRIRPIHHWKEERVRAHVFLCMLAEYVRWHMERDLAPMLFVDDTRDISDTPLHASAPSRGAREKTSTLHAPDGLPVHSFSTLMSELSTMAKTTLHLAGTPSDATFVRLTKPTPTQTTAFQLLNINLM
ncbi:transposase, IS4 family protein [mine drainage metagenome]|uniref:Transposase, IS4 family protein n=1 Tax=mine drainage metagenome TaxID=410659 RepID=T1C815_9ZZZZ